MADDAVHDQGAAGQAVQNMNLMFGLAAPLKLPRKLRLAVIGTVGHIGDVLAPLPKLPEVELVAVAETDPDGLKIVAGRPLLRNAKQYSDYRKMLDEMKPDVVAICNDNGARAAAVLECAQRKLPMMAEKPLAIDRPTDSVDFADAL